MRFLFNLFCGRRVPRALITGILALILLLNSALHVSANPKLAKEDEIKAAFLYNFTKFISWPDHAFTSSSSPFRLCLLGGTTMETILTTVHGKQIGERSLEVVSFNNIKQLASCQILFVGDTDLNTQKKALAAVHGKPVLTVGENRGFARQGGVINFYIDEERVLFEVNTATIDQVGLTVSSRLLSLARIVKGAN